MKRLFTTLIACIFVFSLSIGQKTIFLEEQEYQLEDARLSAWVIPVEHNLDLALEDLQAFCKDQNDHKLKKAGENLIVGEKLSIPAISTKRGDLIAKGFITETYYGIALVFRLGYDIALNSALWELEMKNFRSFARDFMSYHYNESYARRVKGVEDQISALEKENKQTLNQVDSNNKKIQNLEKKIEKEDDEAKIGQLNSEIETFKQEIESLTASSSGILDQIEALKEDILKLNEELQSVQMNIQSL